MQLASLESTRSIPESISPDHSFGWLNTYGFCCDVDEPMVDSASLMHPFIDRETRSTPSSSSELLIFGRFIVFRSVTYFHIFSEGFGKVRFFGVRVCVELD